MSLHRPVVSAIALTLTLVLVTAVARPAHADDAPPAPKADGDAPKPDAPKKDEPKPDTPPPAAAPAPTTEQLLADMADTKFAVKRLDAAIAAKSVHDPKLLPALSKLAKDEQPDIRLAAIAALGARIDGDQKKKAADTLGDRIKSLNGKPEADAERMALCAALHDLAQVGSIDALIGDIDYGASLDEVDARCHAVANVPSPKAIEALIGFMQKRHRDGTGYRASCAKALTYATGERGGNDADYWRAWWKDHEKTFDFEAAASLREKAAADKAEKSLRKEKAKEKAGKGDKGAK
ncbi:MAG: HEAT repeat domain-containing protein [Planctomycetes bacterium]|nr:HEAT repeat domain-containing protein [Planctomycetota bacterium]